MDLERQMDLKLLGITKDYRNKCWYFESQMIRGFALWGKDLRLGKYLSSDSTNKNTFAPELPKFNPLEMTQNNEFFLVIEKKYRGITGKTSLGDLDIEKEIITSYKKGYYVQRSNGGCIQHELQSHQGSKWKYLDKKIGCVQGCCLLIIYPKFVIIL